MTALAQDEQEVQAAAMAQLVESASRNDIVSLCAALDSGGWRLDAFLPVGTGADGQPQMRCEFLGHSRAVC
jgi:hypothetical protein